MKRFLIILSVILLSGAGYFTYEKWVKHARLSPWSFVPSDAAIVFDMYLMDDFDAIQSTNSWKLLSQSSGSKNLKRSLHFLDSINGEDGFSTLFNEVPTLISLHKVSNTDLDYLFVVDIQNLQQNTFISAAIGRLKTAGYRVRTRNYNGFRISEVGQDGRLLTYIFYKHFFLASFTPYLIEDAIRTIDDASLPSFAELYKEGRSGNVHINYPELSNLSEVFSSTKADFPVVSGSYELSIDSLYLHLTGTSTPGKSLSNHLSPPRNFEISSIIPSNTALFYHYSSSEMGLWKSKHLQLLSEDPTASKLTDSLNTTLDYHPSQVMDLLDDELGLAVLEASRPNDIRKLLILKVKDLGASLAYFNQLIARSALSSGDSVYVEPYSKREIKYFPVKEFPMTILGEKARGFSQCFFIDYRNYLIFSNNLQELKGFVGSTESEETWGKSVRMNNFLAQTNAEANMSLFLNVPRAWSLFDPYIRDEWVPHFDLNKAFYQESELCAFQFTWIDDQYYTSFTFSQPEERQPISSKVKSDKSAVFGKPLITKPNLVKTHAYRNYDVIVQDEAYTLFYLNSTLSTLWTAQLKSPIVSSIFGIDYYNNGKIQCLFATEDQVHILDRTGKYIPGYPKKLPGNPRLEHLNLIDYDRSKNYRIGITDVNGKVYLTDKDLKVLKGWDPLPYTRPAIQPLRHARLGTKDVMISIQKNGQVHVTNRRGQRIAGFPFKTQTTLGDNYYLNPSNSLASSTINVLSEQGELTEISLSGVVVNRTQLIKNEAETKFSLVPDRQEKSFIMIRKEENKFDVLDATGNLLFTKEYLSRAEVITQYYQFGAGKDLIIFTDTGNSSLYIYSTTGELITGTPIRSGHEVGIIYSSSKKELRVYATSEDQVEFYQFYY